MVFGQSRIRVLWRTVALAALLLTLGLVQSGAVQAAERLGLVFRADCTGFTSRGGAIKLDRDTTGNNRETFIITATDGTGKTIFAPAAESFLIGSTLNFPIGAKFAWTEPPTANPLVIRVYSPAGNGWPEQTIYSTAGVCDDLIHINFDQFITVEALDGRTSPTVGINQDPPRPTTPEGVTELLPGYVIVNTGQLNMRSGPDIKYSIVGRIAGGTRVPVIGRTEDRSWWYVKVGDIVGWIRGELTIIRGDLTNVPVVPVQGEPNLPRIIVFRTQPLLIVPQEGSLAYCEIAGNLEYYVVGRTGDNEWYEIEAVCGDAPVTGWIAAENGGIRNPGDYRIPITD